MLFFTAFANESPTHLEPLIAGHLFGLLPGVHRIALENNKVQLTLCIGPAPVMAREIDIAADSVLTTSLEEWDARSIARLCRRGTALAWSTLPAHVLQALQQQGVQVNDPSQGGVYLPQWTPKTSLRPSVSAPLNQTQKDANRHAVVIGAGLSGAAVAYSLATRGWTVEVLDQAKNPGAGASGLPAGIFATHVSPDNNVLSRITRDGVRATMQRAKQL
ncbi:MAG: tRNA 5-methylaminomethyl-2-thiouridine biosynthesis bifunctional protein MnmC, partial [Pseudomonadota bacterium]